MALPGSRRLKAGVLIACAAATLVCSTFVFSATGRASGGPEGPRFGYGTAVEESRAVGYCVIFVKSTAKYRGCVIRQLLRLVVTSHDPAHEVPRIDRYVRSRGGWVELNCHIVMHTVGRRYGRIAHVTLSRLLDYLPRSNDPGCSAGFAHGLLTYLGPQIVRLGPAGASADCHRAPTRYQRYSCIHGLGHAYARMFMDAIDPALASCRHLGSDDAPDCAQGVYHDYWIALSGADGTSRPDGIVATPRDLCERQPEEFVRACWYRALLERPPRQGVETAVDIAAVCSGLDGLQHEACVTAASLVDSDDPFRQLAVCVDMRGDDAAGCVRGVRVPALAGRPLSSRLRLIRGCAAIDHAAQQRCYEWLGKTLNVIANGGFATQGCATLRYPSTRAACVRGALSYEGALETFS